ncbi:MAG: integrative and conjugative element protein (TIGR02256 family) [Sediminicola sp.]|jgi:integrative and conjugative element protein (TIGR02256 family)
MGSEWRMPISGNGDIRIATPLILKLSNYCQLKNNQPESGGVLIGKHLNTNGSLLIDNFTPPQPTDKQERCLYYRSEEHSKIVKNVWQESNKHSTYVGLWHTHPEPIPSFSLTDRKDWSNALNNSRYEGDKLFFIIVGQTHIRCWIGTKYVFKNKIELLGEYTIEQ